VKSLPALFALGGLALVIAGLNGTRSVAVAGLAMIVLAILGQFALRR
jgi:hypothetical protein